MCPGAIQKENIQPREGTIGLVHILPTPLFHLTAVISIQPQTTERAGHYMLHFMIQAIVPLC